MDIRYIRAEHDHRYWFNVILNHYPNAAEEARIQREIQQAMETLGVPERQVYVTVIKMPRGGEEAPPSQRPPDRVDEGDHFLLCVLLPPRPRGELATPPDEVKQKVIRGFRELHRLSPAGVDFELETVAAVVLEDAGLTVEMVPDRELYQEPFPDYVRRQKKADE